ncbi:MAG: imidazole glycerol phosphate synthase subunit HisH [Chloroflexota bacterium]
MSDKVVVVDAGTGNLRSVVAALTKIGATVKVTGNADEISRAGRLVLPGVGAFSEFMRGLTAKGLQEALQEYITSRRPLLGICVGMQALLEMSEEMGQFAGLGVITGRVRKFPKVESYKVPHTGWNQVWLEKDSPLTRGLSSGFYVYFNHSYFCQPEQSSIVLGVTDYSVNFCSIFGDGVVFGVQFHPEKSQRIGERLLWNFLQL